MDQEGRSSPCLRLACLRHGHAPCEHEERHVDADRPRGDERPSAPSWTTLSAPARVPLPTHWITQDALLDMIDAIDADMHARPGDAELTPWHLVLDCAPQHIAAQFNSIMRDTRPHIKLCCFQRNFTGYTQPLDRAYMRPFKNSIRQEPSSSWKSSPTSNVSIWTPAPQCSASCCSRSCTQQHRTQTARNIEPLAGASSIGTRWSSVSFSQKQNAF